MSDATATSSAWQPLASLDELDRVSRLVRSVAGVEVLLLRSGGELIALHTRCTHLGLSLAGGRVIGGAITCPHHNACFELATGKAISGPAVAPLRRFPLRCEGRQVLIDLGSLPGGRTTAAPVIQ